MLRFLHRFHYRHQEPVYAANRCVISGEQVRMQTRTSLPKMLRYFEQYLRPNIADLSILHGNAAAIGAERRENG